MSLSRAEFRVGGMSCNGCVQSIRKGLDPLPGIDALDVVVGRVRVEYDPTLVDTNQMIATIADLGFDVAIT